MFHMCPHCQHLLLAGTDQAGQTVICRNCQTMIALPEFQSFDESVQILQEHEKKQPEGSTSALTGTH